MLGALDLKVWNIWAPCNFSLVSVALKSEFLLNKKFMSSSWNMHLSIKCEQNTKPARGLSHNVLKHDKYMLLYEGENGYSVETAVN